MIATSDAASPRAGTRLQIRTRLALWYSFVVFLALVAAGGAVLWLQGRLGVARIDDELAAAAVAVAGVLQNELDERLVIRDGVQDVMSELKLPRAGADQGDAVRARHGNAAHRHVGLAAAASS